METWATSRYLPVLTIFTFWWRLVGTNQGCRNTNTFVFLGGGPCCTFWFCIWSTASTEAHCVSDHTLGINLQWNNSQAVYTLVGLVIYHLPRYFLILTLSFILTVGPQCPWLSEHTRAAGFFRKNMIIAARIIKPIAYRHVIRQTQMPMNPS